MVAAGGDRTNPTLDHLEAIAKFFAVPVTYFLEDEAMERIDARMELLAALKDSGVTGISIRAVGISADGLRAIAVMLDTLRSAQGLPPVDDPAQGDAG